MTALRPGGGPRMPFGGTAARVALVLALTYGAIWTLAAIYKVTLW